MACNGGCDLNSFLETYHYSNGTNLEINGYLDDAISEYREAIALNPGEGFYRYNLGVALLKNCQYNDAYKELLEAVRLNPEYFEARCALADVNSAIGFNSLAIGRYDEAAESFLEAISIDPGFSNYHNGLGCTLMGIARSNAAGTDQKCLESAIRELMAAIDMDGENREARTNLCTALRLCTSEKLQAEGLEFLSKILEADPFDESVRSSFEALAQGEYYI